MKHITYRVAVAVLAFVCGLAAAWLSGVPHRLGAYLGVNSGIYIKLGLFTPTYRACKPGYRQGYRLLNGQEMAEGSACYDTPELAQSEWQAKLAKASKVLERVPNFKNRFGVEGERIVLVHMPDESGEEQASVLWYGGDECFLYIDAPSLEIALEFEKANAYAY